jgi:hypothetical protein
MRKGLSGNGYEPPNDPRDEYADCERGWDPTAPLVEEQLRNHMAGPGEVVTSREDLP